VKTRIRIRFVKQDLWIGVYWKSEWSVVGYVFDRKYYRKFTDDGKWGRDSLTIYVCVVPCFPIIIERFVNA